MTRLSLVLCGLVLISTSTLATPNKPACGNNPECSLAKLNTLRSLASRGNKEVSFTLGHIFMNPESGVKTDLENSFYYFRKAAHQGFLPAYRQTAGMLSQGFGTEKNLTEAKSWMKKAAEKGVNKAAEEYAVLVFTDPSSSKEEHEEAVEMLNKQVQLGMSYLANYMLAVLHIDGQYVDKDFKRASELLTFPASGNYANAAQLLSQMGEYSDVKSDLQATLIEDKNAVLDQDIEVISVVGISETLEDLNAMMMDQLQKNHGQTGSHIKGNGCMRRKSNCKIIDEGFLRNQTFWTIQ